MIEIAGDILEGGGQILRNSAALSCILSKSITISNIRAKRKQPGLRPQHLCGFQLLGEMCRATISGDTVNSTQVHLNPGPTIIGGCYHKEVGTAGSLVLLLQAVLPVSLFGHEPSIITLGGGTNAEMAPPIDYFMSVFSPIASHMGINTQCRLKKRGFYPKGGGRVVVEVTPVKTIKPITILERGTIKEITGFAYTAGQLHIRIAQKMAQQAEKVLRDQLSSDIPINIVTSYEPSSRALATGCGIFLKAITTTDCLFGGTGFGRKGKPAEDVGREAAEELLRGILEQGCVDEHLQDQLIIFMALADGKSQMRCGPLTLHTETAVHIAETITGVKFSVEDQDDGTKIVSCTGMGLINQNIQ